MTKLHIKHILPYFFMLPALLIGTIAMIFYGVDISIWIQNIFIWMLGVCFCYVILNKTPLIELHKNPLLVTSILTILLILPFWFNGLEGVHRWVTLGPFNFYMASIILPMLIVYLWRLSKSNYLPYVIGFMILIGGILLLQPDAGQITAFACASTIILWPAKENPKWQYITLIILTLYVFTFWIYIDHLAPVPYVEQIIFLVADMGSMLLILGVGALLLLVYPFFITWKKDILGLYFLMTILVTFFGHFPMPIMGYGISPIIGYLIGMTATQKIKMAQTN